MTLFCARLKAYNKTMGKGEILGVKLTDKKILIVDDDPHVLKSIARFLTKQGYTVSTAPGGKEALVMMEKEVPDLVLLDVLMPEMDGIETLEIIRQRWPDVDVVMISALREEAVARASIKMGAYEWLPKPFSMEQLDRTLFVTFLHHERFEESSVP